MHAAGWQALGQICAAVDCGTYPNGWREVPAQSCKRVRSASNAVQAHVELRYMCATLSTVLPFRAHMPISTCPCTIRSHACRSNQHHQMWEHLLSSCRHCSCWHACPKHTICTPRENAILCVGLLGDDHADNNGQNASVASAMQKVDEAVTYVTAGGTDMLTAHDAAGLDNVINC